MNRRTYLVAVAGSSSLAVGGLVAAHTQQKSSPEIAEDPPEDAERQISIEDVGSIPDESPVAFDVEVDDPWITPSSTATVEITTTNRDDRSHQVDAAFLKGASADRSDRGIVVYNHRAADFEVDEYVPPCFAEDVDPIVWTSEGYIDEDVDLNDVDPAEEDVGIMFTMEPTPQDRLGPGESRTEQFIVADDPLVDACFPPGTYEFAGEDLAFEVDGASVDVRLTWELTAESV
ncbi:hypothetical protein G6M89_00880 [Natronolimnobius sp. AArcel1]|uniref:hypothetical protein n=1 Tax=Natronolimnobius sp. AArcel1 TaxID=1679093 RepID=UPI0013EDEA53|nr:hypothetical protein [Natronolimnobius sp. AArcel1]NGM67573.1 hypothetical protein [Natronolimnobius sp. AArcel1]